MKTGTLVRDLSEKYAEQMKQMRICKELAAGTIEVSRYLGYIASMYPVVVGFSGALNRMIGLFDPVLTKPRIFASLYRQGQEEVAHNNLWRDMLELYRIDHVKMYEVFEAYRRSLGRFEMHEFAEIYIRNIHDDGAVNYVPDYVYQNAPFPATVHALTYFQRRTSSEDRSPWIHFACQGAVEGAILNAVTSHIYQAVRYPIAELQSRLNLKDARSYGWWGEHIMVRSNGEPTDEVRHLNIAIDFLDHYVPETDSLLQYQIVANVEITLRLFAASMKWHDDRIFDISPFMKSSTV